jgi:hypothetical protein
LYVSFFSFFSYILITSCIYSLYRSLSGSLCVTRHLEHHSQPPGVILALGRCHRIRKWRIKWKPGNNEYQMWRHWYLVRPEGDVTVSHDNSLTQSLAQSASGSYILTFFGKYENSSLSFILFTFIFNTIYLVCFLSWNTQHELLNFLINFHTKR